MATCPAGHESADEEFCEVCGREIGGPAPVAAPSGSSAAATVSDASSDVPEDATCPACGAALAGRFCEACGHDSLAPPPVAVARPSDSAPADAAPDTASSNASAAGAAASAATAWTAVVTADRAYYDTVMAAEGPDAGGIGFPPFCPDRQFALRGKQISIGRRSKSRGIDPDIDLTGPPEDPGVSHLHALLVARDDGWAVVDLDSSNGTSVNDERSSLPANAPRPLADGDRVYVGAWTKITLRRG
jgi:FHA domain-containing protein